MKYIYTFILVGLFSLQLNAQIGIGKSDVDGINTIIDFDNTTTNTKGIILPAVTTTPIGLSPVDNGGTFLYDTSDAKVKMYENGTWVSLTDVGDKASVLINSSTEIGDGVLIGATTTQAKGALVLESDNKAMILPKINKPEINVKSPYPGMMCYDTASKTLAIFDGKVWSYWK